MIPFVACCQPAAHTHDGKPVRSEDCIGSLKRWATRDSMGLKLATIIDRWEEVDTPEHKQIGPDDQIGSGPHVFKRDEYRPGEKPWRRESRIGPLLRPIPRGKPGPQGNHAIFATRLCAVKHTTCRRSPSIDFFAGSRAAQEIQARDFDLIE